MLIQDVEAVLQQKTFQAHDRDTRPAIPPARRGILGRSLISACAMALGVAVCDQALADWGRAEIYELNPITIEVDSDGKSYTALSGSSPAIKGRMVVRFDAQTFGRVRSWAAWLKIKSPYVPWQQFKDLGYSKSYPLGDRPKKVARDLPFSIPPQSYKGVAKQACNENASRLRSESGMDDEEIFSADRETFVRLDTAISWDMSGAATEILPVLPTGHVIPTSITVVCKKTPPPAPAITGSAVGVQGYDPVNAGGKCQIKLNGSIISNVPGVDVTFRYVDGTGKQSELKTVTTNANRSATFKHEYPLSPGHKTGKVRIVGENFNFTSNWKDYDFECGAEPTNDLLTLLPPKAMLLEVGAMAPEFNYKDHICPVKAKIIGSYKGRGTVSGTAVLAAKGQPKVMKSYSIEDGQTKYIDGEFVLPWKTVQGRLRQSVNFEMIILNAQGAQVDYMKKSVNFTCRKNPALTNLSGGGAAAPSRQPAAKGMVLQLESDFTILAPRRFVRDGVIRLKDVERDQVFKLAFLRKTGGGYKRYSSPQLPKQMTGAKARFNLRALAAGDWRLKVCGAKVKTKSRTAGPGNCRHSDFKVMKGNKPGLQKTPARRE